MTQMYLRKDGSVDLMDSDGSDIVVILRREFTSESTPGVELSYAVTRTYRGGLVAQGERHLESEGKILMDGSPVGYFSLMKVPEDADDLPTAQDLGIGDS